MPHPRLALRGLLVALPLLGRAQTAPEAVPTPRFYVGLAAYHSSFQHLGHWRQGDTGLRVPLQLTAGYQLRPRLALELGAAYSGRTSVYGYADYYDGGSGLPVTYVYSNTTTDRTMAVSALARYGLRRPVCRLQVEALGGFTLVHGSLYSRGYQGNNLSGSLQNAPFAARSSSNYLLLTLGLGVRYQLSSRFALNFDAATNRNLSHPAVYNGYTGTAALGVRYRFGPQ